MNTEHTLEKEENYNRKNKTLFTGADAVPTEPILEVTNNRVVILLRDVDTLDHLPQIPEGAKLSIVNPKGGKLVLNDQNQDFLLHNGGTAEIHRNGGNIEIQNEGTVFAYDNHEKIDVTGNQGLFLAIRNEGELNFTGNEQLINIRENTGKIIAPDNENVIIARDNTGVIDVTGNKGKVVRENNTGKIKPSSFHFLFLWIHKLITR